MKKLSLLMISLLITLTTSAQTNIRYVSKHGAYSNDGRSWANAKNNIQDAINDLVDKGQDGEVWVGAGVYTPTESTESSAASTLYLSFKIPAGITVRGGFPDNPQDGVDTPETRAKTPFESVAWFYTNRTILSGDLSARPDFQWDSKKEQWNPTFFGNCYHVVWFAMNGFDANGRANALTKPAMVEGCVIQGGHAYNNAIGVREHNAFGGGAYMVGNSKLENCWINKCDASRDGGGVYMDGGGQATHVYVSECQALGVGIENGFGGGICIEGGSSKTVGSVAQSGIADCVGRMGGGLALKVTSSDPSMANYVAANTSLVNNNTATVEGGGVYTLNGGTMTNMTIVRNKCNGTGITSQGVVTGRSGGVYCRNNAIIANSVIWGNTCAANNDVQFATSRSDVNIKPSFLYNSISRSDYVDWSGTTKKGVKTLAEENSTTATSTQNYPLFINPTPNAGAGHFETMDETAIGRDINDDDKITATAKVPMGVLNILKYSFAVHSESAMHHAGIQTLDLLGIEEDPFGAVITKDIKGDSYNPRCTEGAYALSDNNIAPTVDGSNVNFFVDPNKQFTQHYAEAKGVSWDLPTRVLSNVLELIRKDANSSSPQWTGKTINVYVKEGKVDNTNSSSSGRIRLVSIDIPSNVNLYGSYYAELTGSEVGAENRNPVHNPTIITGDIMGDYETNVAHLITIKNASNILMDGFQIRNANALSTRLTSKNKNGAAITIVGSTENIKFRNIVIASCQAEKGAVVYAENSDASFENCIFHNNTTKELYPGGSIKELYGNIYNTGTSNLTFSHCDVLRNVGYASELDGSNAHNEWTNSIFYGNMDKELDDTNTNADDGSNPNALASFKGTTANATGNHCMFDAASASFSSQFGGNDTGNQWQYNLQYKYADGTGQGYPRFINPTKNAGISPDGDITYYGREASYEPHNNNPMVNLASYSGTHDNWGTDLVGVTRDFGGLPDIGAMENHLNVSKTTENAYNDGQPAYGNGYYVRDYRDGSGNIDYTAGGDGSSWANAINGNAFYHANGTHDGDASGETGEIDHYEDNWVTATTEGEKTALPTTDNQSIKVVLKNNDKYLVYQGTATLTTTTNIAEATEFTITKTRTYTSGSGYTERTNYEYTIQTEYKGSPVYLGYTGTNNGAKFTNAPSNDKRYWSNRSNGGTSASFCNKTPSALENNKRYLSSEGISSSETEWTFYKKVTNTTNTPIPVYKTLTRGLQYAVNKANLAFQNEGGTSAQKKMVYVGAGTYTNSTASQNASSVSQPYAWMMKEGVDVYGGFPGIGNPGMDQRNPKLNETILQPQTQSPYVKHSFSSDVKVVIKDSDWGSCARKENGEESPSVGRVLVQPTDFDVDTRWDGFTVRHGYLLTARRNNIGPELRLLTPADIENAGGAGVLLKEKGILSNCKVTENLILCSPDNNNMVFTGATSKDANGLWTFHMAGAGIFMNSKVNPSNHKQITGNGAVVENCEIFNNQILTKLEKRSSGGKTVSDNNWSYGFGIYQNGGNVYNTIIHDNMGATVEGSVTKSGFSSGTGNNNEMLLGGVFVASGNFFNNTVVKNSATSLLGVHNNHCTFSGIHVFDAAVIYNSIVSENISHWSYEGTGTSPGNGVPISAFLDTDSKRTSRDATKVHVYYSFVDVNVGETNGEGEQVAAVDLVSPNDTGKTNIYFNRIQGTSVTTPALSSSSSKAEFTDNVYYKTGTNIYQLKSGSIAINHGTNNIPGVTIPDYDAAYAERIQDCTIDMGAYEYNGANDIDPDVTSVNGQAIYYVTPQGKGLATAADPENAACAAKLQKVLDAAGRYKYNNPTKQVIVKVANDYAMQHPASGLDGDKENFTYYATRTTDETNQDVRVWSIIIPRGVEVWGGYADATSTLSYKDVTNSNNGFYKVAVQADVTAGLAKNVDDKIDLRDIVGNPTYFDSYYENKMEKSSANTYHVVTFTDHIYDANGKPYITGNTVGGTSTYNPDAPTTPTFLQMSSKVSGNVTTVSGKTFSARAVLDGIFVSGGMANAKSSATSGSVNKDAYGGAAIVTDYAMVRNCVLTGNYATNGGALALEPRAMVAGTLMMQNEADKGGALYVFEETVNTADNPMDANMAHVITSTIVNNHANQGGGVWFSSDATPNARFNSVVVWQNQADDQANVSGNVNPVKADNDPHSAIEFYPFAYSAIQNIRATGMNNMSTNSINNLGTRFIKGSKDLVDQISVAAETSSEGFEKYEDFGYFGLTNYSILTRTGMPTTEYEKYIKNMAVGSYDFRNQNRLSPGTVGSRAYIEIGARAIDKEISNNEVMLRLFVAKSEDVNMQAAEDMMSLASKNEPSDVEKYYSQEGSSFAYPFQSLQDALDYIYYQRTNPTQLSAYGTNNLPFEICVARGTYYPTRDLVGHYGQSLGNSFAIPEGVSLYGGFNCKGGLIYDHGTIDWTQSSFFGRGNTMKTVGNHDNLTDHVTNVENNVTPIGTASVTIKDTYKISQLPITSLLESRDHEDINSNNVIEPWEFKNQTVLSGDAINAANSGVYHVVLAVPDQTVVGMLPLAAKDQTANAYTSVGTYASTGYEDYEEGQVIRLDGLTISDGYARHYVDQVLDDNGKFSYYHGGALLVDGNRYNDNYNKQSDLSNPQLVWKSSDHSTATNLDNEHSMYMHTGVSNAVGYRDIPLSISKCKFVNNTAGYGGAISSNTTLDIFSSSFEQNYAQNGDDTNVPFDGDNKEVMYPGNGGAIYGTHQLSFFNTLFANNEAKNDGYSIELEPYKTLRTQVDPPAIPAGCGGAVYVGKSGFFHIVNCDFVHNKANMYPAVFTMNPNRKLTGKVETMMAIQTPQYSQFTNTLFWQNEVNENMGDDNEVFNFASKLFCNVAFKTLDTAYSPAFEKDKAPKNQTELDANYEETAWFCAYEEGTGHTQNNREDYRNIDYKPYGHAVYQISKFATGTYNKANYQNCNILIASENKVLEGPNFVNPSPKAGLEGYNESADWSPARLNKLTDQGSGRMNQTISVVGDKYTSTFDKYASDAEIPADRITGSYAYSNEAVNDYVTSGAYTMTHYVEAFPEYKRNLPLGDDFYMKSAFVQDNGNQQDLLRISYDPNPTHNQTYIDIGVYEYPHTALRFKTEGDEVDVLWVSSAEKPDNGLPEGYDWSRPTSDFQRAIETLLSSRNGHRKEIRVMDGSYTPIYRIGEHLAFYFDTKTMNESVMLPYKKDSNGDDTEEIDPDLKGGIKSFTIKGGYSKDLYEQYNVDLYPAVIVQQKRTDDTSAAWDHLFYINDATQRYGLSQNKNDYDSNNGWGVYREEADRSAGKVYTIPIEFDGLTLINDQAREETEGAAIYYADQALDDNYSVVPDGVAATKRPKKPTAANLSRVQYYEDEGMTVETDQPHMKFLKRKTTDPMYSVVDNPAKLIISKSTILGSGNHNDILTPSKDCSAVYIGKYGGSALVYNTIFHSNFGHPLHAYSTKTVNNTFALNSKELKLKNTTGNTAYDTNVAAANPSLIYNTVMWCNNDEDATNGIYKPQFSLEGYVDAQSSGAIFKRNAYTNYAGSTASSETNYEEFNADGVTHTAMHQANYNAQLSNDNNDVILGPNFVNPGTSGDNTRTQLMMRDFSLKPSLRLLNKGENTLYADGTWRANGVADLDFDNDGNLDAGVMLYDYAWLPTMRHDAISNPRFKANTIDVGACEYLYDLNRILYVDPNKGINDMGTGWDTPLGIGNMQNAIDLAGVYHENHPNLEAYVFVKGASATSSNLVIGEDIVLRNGVSVYGSLSTSLNENFNPGNLKDYTNNEAEFVADINKYIDDMLAVSEGVASSTANRSVIKSISTSAATTFSVPNLHQTVDNPDYICALVDGFVVKDGNVSAPVININPSQASIDNNGAICLRNIIVAENNMTKSNTNIANIKNALLYETLMRDNTVSGNGVTLNVGTGAYVVNATIEGKTTGADGKQLLNGYGTATTNDAKAAAEKESHVFSSLTNYANDVATKNTLSGYNYALEDKNLNYQLAEGSKHIDAINSVCSVEGDHNCYNPEHYLPRHLAEFVDYTRDRDILGNPRLLTGVTKDSKLDRGAFETWKVEYNFICGANGTASASPISSRFYPHDGSVVYIMKDKTLVIDPMDAHQVKDSPHNPGFMLLQEGASCYGNGRPMTCSYLAIERSVKSEGNIISMPYRMNYYDNVDIPSYDANGVLKLEHNAGLYYSYNGNARADWQFNFRDQDSPCWQSSVMPIAANNAVLYIPGEDKGTLRFTGKGTSMIDYIYEESGNSKTIELTRYNDGGRGASDRDGNEEGTYKPDLTEKEDMGWNAIGLPYLVSQYNTWETISDEVATNEYALVGDDKTAAVGKYMMHIPHTLWMFFDGKKYADGTDMTPGVNGAGDGGFYAVNSWESSNNLTTNNPWHVSTTAEQSIWVGEGFFTQTAALNPTETLTFYRPVVPADFHAVKTERWYMTDEIREVEDTAGKRIIATRYYTPDGILQAKPVKGITIQVDFYDDGTQKSHKYMKKR